MSEIKLHVKVHDEFHADLVKRAMDDTINDCLEACGIQCEKYAVLNINGDFGHIKRVDTGRLKGSITHDTRTSEKAVYVSTNVEYAPYVHEGTSRMAPNRFLRDAAEQHKDEYLQIFKDALK